MLIDRVPNGLARKPIIASCLLAASGRLVWPRFSGQLNKPSTSAPGRKQASLQCGILLPLARL